MLFMFVKLHKLRLEMWSSLCYLFGS